MTLRRLIGKTIKFYKQAVNQAFSEKNLFCTNVVLSVAISTTGDLLEQGYECYRQDIYKFDFRRTSHMAFSGCTAGVLCHHWYNFLDKIIIKRTIKNVMKKLILDQCIWSPIVILSFIATVAIFEDNPIENFTDEVHEKFWILYKAEWVVWPPAQIINFYFLPTKYRVLYDNTISLGYDIYTSHIKHSKTTKNEK
ncbi:mpv17-like protein 2 [Maniola hyperantus]|uniref:mpv17-like protein 2 n=1 Tax=Aphantopus hyperantus TaxID=2795564 RepID=UPI001567D7E0|nr:mpv17-like protein 2 [Maniola hyperantus]